MDEAGKPNDEMESMRLRSSKASAKEGHAFARLLTLAKTRKFGRIPRIAKFIASTYNGDAFPFVLFELRALDIEISDDIFLCIDALRWGSRSVQPDPQWRQAGQGRDRTLGFEVAGIRVIVRGASA